MSYRTRCNYCVLRDMKREYGKTLKTEPKDGGIDVYTTTKTGRRKLLAWLMAITDHCVC